MNEIAIRVEGISKRYRIGSRLARYRTLRESLVNFAKLPAGQFSSERGSSKHPRRNGKNTIWALKDVAFQVRRGEVVGLIGANGSGKSTLLKILSRITDPTRGFAEIYGRVSSLLEVGTGFHPELTGRENIYLNGAILGMRNTEIKRRFDEIVAFAEVERFIDTEVKHYSSGMYLRLAFAVAAHLEPEILLVDEVLAVGDVAFQRKCLGKMGDVAKEGRTVLLVSHNMASITRLADKALWLKEGRFQEFGDPECVVAKYLASGVSQFAEVEFPSNPDSPGSEYVRLLAARIRDSQGQVTNTLDCRRPFSVEVEYQILRLVDNLRIGITLTTQDSTVVLASKDTDNFDDGMIRTPGTYFGRCTIPGEFLNNGQYFVSLGSDTPMIQSHFWLDRLLAFHIEQTGGANGHIHDRRLGLIRMRFPWETRKVDRPADSRQMELQPTGRQDS
jgi:lipopolysaccharide transport system ATP-binding protein